MAGREPLPTWRKVLAVVVLLLVVGPLLFSMFYSAMTRTTFGSAFAKVGFYYPYLGVFVVIAFVIGISDLSRRWGKRRPSPTVRQSAKSPVHWTEPFWGNVLILGGILTSVDVAVMAYGKLKKAW